MRLRRSEKCLIHDSYFCCGRERNGLKRNQGISRGPVTRIPDEHHPRGYRERCSTTELRRRLNLKLGYQDGICAWCHAPIVDFREASLDHCEPRGMGAANRDDHMDNLVAVHNRCNREKGSRRFPLNEAGLYVVSSQQVSCGVGAAAGSKEGLGTLTAQSARSEPANDRGEELVGEPSPQEKLS